MVERQPYHPEVYTPAEAAEYLRLPADSERTLKTLRDKGWLRGVQLGNELRYLKADLDRCIAMAFGIDQNFKDTAKDMKHRGKGPHLKLAGGAV